MNHYPRHIGDWMRDTAHLSELEECYYSRLLDQYYIREKPLPGPVEQCCRLVRAATTATRKVVASVLAEFFALQTDGWHQKRCDEELAAFRARSESAKVSAKASVEARKRARDGPTNVERTLNDPLKIRSTNGELASSHKPEAINPRVASQPVGLAPDDPPKPPAEKPINGRAYNADARGILQFLNDKAGKKFPPSDSNVGVIVARLKEGFKPAQIRQVVAMKVRKWKGDEKMAEYMRPETLFNRTKFSNYVGELVDIPESEDAA